MQIYNTIYSSSKMHVVWSFFECESYVTELSMSAIPLWTLDSHWFLSEPWPRLPNSHIHKCMNHSNNNRNSTTMSVLCFLNYDNSYNLCRASRTLDAPSPAVATTTGETPYFLYGCRWSPARHAIFWRLLWLSVAWHCSRPSQIADSTPRFPNFSIPFSNF